MTNGYQKKKMPGSLLGPVQIVLGSLGLAIFGSLWLGLFVAGLATRGTSGLISATFTVGWIILLPFLILSIVLLARGILTQKRLDRLSNYLTILKNKSYIMLADLAQASGQTLKQLRQDIQYIIDNRILPGARLDQEETCLLLNRESIDLYEAARESRRQREEEEERRQKEREQWEQVSEGDDELHDFHLKAESYLNALNHYQRQIISPVMGPALDQLELSLTRIFVCVRNHPDKVRMVRRLMNYYIPSQMDLLATYEDLERQPVQGENIQQTRKEIEDSTKTLNDALITMFDELFQEDALNVSADIQVLRTMLSRDGWIKESQINWEPQIKED